MWDFFWDLRQHRDIIQNRNSAIDAKHSAAKARQASKNLEHQIEKLKLVNMAFWQLMKDRLGITDDELTEMVRQIDLSDGLLDGKAAKKAPSSCPKCSRTLAPHHRNCIYCGEVQPNVSEWDTI